MRAMRLLFGLILAATTLPAAKTMEIYFIDTEGGKATLVVGPSGQAMLIDAGYIGFGGRDADRIALAAKNAHVKNLEYLLVSHFHADHMGGVPNLLQRLAVGTFLDHGTSIEARNRELDAYMGALVNHNHQVVKPGDHIAVKGLDITVLTSAGEHIERPGAANPFCAGLTPKEGDAIESTENRMSIGVLIEFGKFRYVDLADLSFNKELALLCPQNRVGKVDLYCTTHHGAEQSKALYGMAPRVAIMNNGPKKGGTPAGWKQIRASPGLEDLWQLHFSIEGGKETNMPDTFIANIDDPCEGKYIKVTASEDGSFTVYNSRNKFTKAYTAR